MPARISRSSLPKGKSSRPQSTGSGGRSRAPKKSAKRALNAFSIASHDNSERNGRVRKNRLGVSDIDARRKRPRDDEDEDEDEDEEEGNDVKRRKQARGGNDSYDEGSDSEGNSWKMGHVDDDDDSDIDSDEAFGESDEERFEGWTFRGSQSNANGGSGKVKRKARDVDMDEGEDFDLDEGDSADGEEDEEDDLGEDAIDLATALDQWEESEEEKKKEKKAKKRKKDKGSKSTFDDSDDEAPSEVDDFAADGASEFSSDGDEEDEEDKQAQLKDFISTLAAEEDEKSSRPKAEIHESSAPSEFGVFRKIDLNSFKSKAADPERKKALKLLQDDKPSTKRNDISRKLEAPLPKRQQDKLDRAAAAAKANETLERWVDTVKHQRRAEHLHFPLYKPDDGGRMGESRLLPTTTAAPTNELESTIQAILQESGLSNGKEDEEKFQQWETLQTNKLPLEEVMKRRAQLRKERELLFREEVRAKRIKKIKSKAYRRVHRKERERLLQRERDALKADGIDVSEDEKEYNDRRRAEERMGAKHRESKWAKGVKASGKAAWDEDARSGVTEMARRNEELRRRIEGKDVRGEDEDASDLSSEDGDDDDEEDDDQILQNQLGRLKENPFSTDKSKLGSMAFMQKAENARRKQNDEDVERLRKELAGEESNSEEDETSTRAGRRKFGPGNKDAAPAIQVQKSEFEERPGSDSEGEAATNDVSNNRHRLKPSKNSSTSDTTSGANPYLMPAKKNKKTNSQPDLALQAFDTIAATQDDKPKPKDKKSDKSKKSDKKSKKVTTTQAAVDHGLAGNPTISAPDDDGFQTISYDHDDSDDADNLSDEGMDLDTFTRNQSLTATAFAGDNVESEFLSEKAALIAEEDTKTTTTTLPGWGSWAGDDLTPRERKRAQGQVTTTTTPGIDPKKRKDAKLDRVIINERRQKANTKYLAGQLPFPFETKEQYERSLRVPKGKEWNTKRVVQEGTKPRVMVKQGVIRPLHKPLV